MNTSLRINRRVAAIILLAAVGLAPGMTLSTRSAAAPAESRQTPAAQEAAGFDQTQKLAELRKQLAGKEDRPAEEVFKNIQMLKGMPAGRLLRVMELGYGRSLGVNCTHCHVVDQWERDDKPPKQIAREMAAMMQAINNDLLKKIKNLKGTNPLVNCTTCHRGQVKPALDLGQ